MEHRIEVLHEIYKRIMVSYNNFFGSYDPQSKTDYQHATYAMIRRASSLVKGINLLISKDLIAESAILARSLINLLWNYLFLIGAKYIDGDKWEFEDNPKQDSPEFKRAHRFLSWHWVTSYRGGNRNEKILKMYQEFKKTFGYQTDEEIPKEWYCEKESKIEKIRDIAIFVGAEKQYDEDYKHLSGIEHSDITAAIIESFELSEESSYRYLILLKSIHILGIMIDFGITILGKRVEEEISSILKEINIISEDFYTKI